MCAFALDIFATSGKFDMLASQTQKAVNEKFRIRSLLFYY